MVLQSMLSSTKAWHPLRDEDLAAETFLQYKGAQAGEIDWRPTETIPEDFYAFERLRCGRDQVEVDPVAAVGPADA